MEVVHATETILLLELRNLARKLLGLRIIELIEKILVHKFNKFSVESARLNALSRA